MATHVLASPLGKGLRPIVVDPTATRWAVVTAAVVDLLAKTFVSSELFVRIREPYDPLAGQNWPTVPAASIAPPAISAPFLAVAPLPPPVLPPPVFARPRPPKPRPSTAVLSGALVRLFMSDR